MNVNNASTVYSQVMILASLSRIRNSYVDASDEEEHQGHARLPQEEIHSTQPLASMV